MLEILLVRRGRPVCDERTRIRGSAFGAWVRAYEDAALDLSIMPSEYARVRAAAAECIVTSTLNRARESAAVLVPGRPVVCDSVYDEVPLPTMIDLGFALEPRAWDFLSRAAWFCGWSGEGEPFSAARRRARTAADRLVALAREHHSVMLVGHGLMNALIRHRLQRAGWSTGPLQKSYWSLTIARLPGAAAES
jgi:broad specificity phosphatase PhoE